MGEPILDYKVPDPPGKESFGFQCGRLSVYSIVATYTVGAIIWLLVIPLLAGALILALIGAYRTRGRSVPAWITLGICGANVLLLLWLLITGR